jgi:hypothetical protein
VRRGTVCEREAALVALANQGRAQKGLASLEQLPAQLYSLYTNPSTQGHFHDITSGSNGYSAKAGYDLVTGLGSPSVSQIVTDLIGITTTTSTSTPKGTSTSTTTRWIRRAWPKRALEVGTTDAAMTTAGSVGAISMTGLATPRPADVPPTTATMHQPSTQAS